MTGHTKTILIVISLLITCFSCVEPYGVRSINFERAIVVDGRFTNEQESNYVKLSYTRPIGEQENVPLQGARVWVEDSDGSRIEFTESEPGYYQPTDGTSGEVGKSYRLFFTTAEGGQYQSSQQELIASPPIDSIYDRYAEKASGTSAEINKGIQFFIDTHDETNRAKYYRYEWEETYEVQAPYPSLYKFFSDPDTAISRAAMGEQIHICYVSAKSSSIIIGSTANLTENRLAEMPVRYISTKTDQLKYTYSLLVKQYVMGAESYSFYREMLGNNQDNESLFDKQLGVVVGNITSVEEPDETVLGFFEVSGVAKKRVFVKFEELDQRFPFPDQQYPCAPEQVVEIIDTQQPLPYDLIDSVSYYVNKGYEIHIAAYCDSLAGCPPPVEFYFKGQLVPKYCGDCRFRGPATKPEFWIY